MMKLRSGKVVERVPKTIYIPRGFRLGTSRIKGAGLGIYVTRKLKKGYKLGFYRGIWYPFPSYEKEVSVDDSGYGWELRLWNKWKERHLGEFVEPYQVAGVIDGRIKKYANFLRYVNHPLNKEMENVEVEQIRGTLLYYTNREVEEGEELYVDYGKEYSEDLIGREL